jgi:hypothetical protein
MFDLYRRLYDWRGCTSVALSPQVPSGLHRSLAFERVWNLSIMVSSPPPPLYPNPDNLSRHDLRPVTSSTSDPTDPTSPTAEGSELPPPLAVNEGSENGAETVAESDNASASPQRRRVSRFLDLNRLRNAPPDERIAALRRLREQSQQDGESAEDVEEPSRRARLTGRLRDTFRIRTRTQNSNTQE